MTLETYLVSSRNGRLKAEFYWRGDRFAHRMSVDGQIVGDSVESDSGAAWPKSPPLQQLSLEEIGGRKTVLGVGGAGRSQWSISVQPCSDGSGEGEPEFDSGSIQFDLACRCQEQPPFLGSKYRIEKPLTLSVIDGQSRRENGAIVVLATDCSDTTRQWSYIFSISDQAP